MKRGVCNFPADSTRVKYKRAPPHDGPASLHHKNAESVYRFFCRRYRHARRRRHRHARRRRCGGRGCPRGRPPLVFLSCLLLAAQSGFGQDVGPFLALLRETRGGEQRCGPR